MTKTIHRIVASDSRRLERIPDGGVDLVVTSPPYPMIEMWDTLFAAFDPEIAPLLAEEGAAAGRTAHERMHKVLDSAWAECFRALRPGGLLCINVGDATRSLGGRFLLYANHVRIASSCLSLGFEALPLILWRKQTNAPTKFMGSGMYPPGAYVTLEHEYILVFRKGEKRGFAGNGEVQNRRESAYFWEERNLWFSDVWDFKGSRQELSASGLRQRSGAFPFELAFRLVSMFSVRGDRVLDPFAGTGTTTLAAALGARNSVAVELDRGLAEAAATRLLDSRELLRRYQEERVERHLRFVEDRRAGGKECGYRSKRHGFPVVTRQESEILLELPSSIGFEDSRAGGPQSSVVGEGIWEVVVEHEDYGAK